MDIDLTKLDGGGGINPKFLVRDPNNGCKTILPHQYLRVNTIFEVVKAHGGRTAWTDKHPSYEWTNGPSGKGVDDFYGPEINSIPVALPHIPGCAPVPFPDTTPDDGWTNSFDDIKCYDSLHVQRRDQPDRRLQPRPFQKGRSAGLVRYQLPVCQCRRKTGDRSGQRYRAAAIRDVLGTPESGPGGRTRFRRSVTRG